MAAEAKSDTTHTADGVISYETYKDIVQHIHQKNCESYGWVYLPLIPGAYGYDNLVYSIDATFKELKKNKDIDQKELAKHIHDAWVTNYKFWRDNKPYEKQPDKYKKPFKPLGDKQRNLCASTSYEDLDDVEKQKDLVLAKIISEYAKSISN
jgi:hypothetical protein